MDFRKCRLAKRPPSPLSEERKLKQKHNVTNNISQEIDWGFSEVLPVVHKIDPETGHR